MILAVTISISNRLGTNETHRRQLRLDTRIDIPDDQTTHLEEIFPAFCQDRDKIETCKIAAQNINFTLNQWLDRSW
jgi:hypothetical protein